MNYKKLFGMDLMINDDTNRNECFDYTLYRSSENIKIELKDTTFGVCDIDNYKNNTLVLELIQCTENIIKVNNASTLNNRSNPSVIHQAVGWFYKCDCDYLVWNKKYKDKNRVYIITWKPFKNYIMSEINSKNMDNKDALTSTVRLDTEKFGVPANLKVDLNKIPSYMYQIFEEGELE